VYGYKKFKKTFKKNLADRAKIVRISIGGKIYLKLLEIG
jgi:hypothetical protein